MSARREREREERKGARGERVRGWSGGADAILLSQRHCAISERRRGGVLLHARDPARSFTARCTYEARCYLWAAARRRCMSARMSCATARPTSRLSERT